jgi:hypothetical protein
MSTTNNGLALTLKPTQLGETRLERVDAARVYVYDLRTRKEIASFAFGGTGAMAVRGGKALTDTRESISVTLLDGPDAGKVRRFDASCYPGPIAVKIWGPSLPTEWYRVVHSDGAGPCPSVAPRAKLGGLSAAV